ncbi:MAG: methyl-accepting chemotaxis protein [Candidatus Methanospirareceae archaeon]
MKEGEGFVDVAKPSFTASDMNQITKLQAELEKKKKEVKALKNFILRLFKSIPAPMHLIYVDREYKIRYISEELAKYRGFNSAEEVVGLEVTKLFPKRGKAIKDAIDTGKSIEIRNTVFGKLVDGVKREVPIIASCHPVYDDNGEVIGAVAAFTEVTALKETQLYDVMDNLLLPCFVVDRNRVVKAMNRACAELTGYSVDEVVGKKKGFEIFKSPEDETCSICDQMTPTIEKGEAKVGEELTFVNRKGEKIPIKVTTVPLYDYQGNVVGGFGLLEDLRAEKKAAMEIDRIVKGIAAGNLGERCNIDLLTGVFMEIGRSVNELLEAIIGPVREIMRICNALSKGDLSERVEIEAKGEFLELTESLNKAIDSLSILLSELREAMNRVSSFSKESASSIEQINSGAQHISSASQEIARGVQEVSSIINEAVNDIKETNMVFQQIERDMEESGRFAVVSAEKAKEMNEWAKKSAEGMRKIQAAVSDAMEVIKKLSDSIEEVGKTTDLIKGIADQTNLLALNAAIEAARAGEYGRGFAVVAEEVRKLAEDSKKSAADIDSMIRGLQKEMDKVMDAASTSVELAAAGYGDLEKAVRSVEKTTNMIEEIKNKLHKTIENTKKGVRSIENVSKGFEDIANRAEEMASSTEETSSAIEQQTAIIEQLNMDIQKLHELSEKAMQMLSKFKLRGDEK